MPRINRLHAVARHLCPAAMNPAAGASVDVEPAFVPPLQLTDGQPAPIAANGGVSYMSFDVDGDAGTGVALEQAVELMATGDPQRVVDMIQNAPPGGIETKWGTGFRRYTECLEHMREQQLSQPLDEGAVALPLKYTVAEHPSYSVVSSNEIWRDESRAAEQEMFRCS